MAKSQPRQPRRKRDWEAARKRLDDAITALANLKMEGATDLQAALRECASARDQLINALNPQRK